MYDVRFIYDLFFCSIDCCDAEGEGDKTGVGKTGIMHVLCKRLAPAERLDTFVEIGVRRFVPTDDAPYRRQYMRKIYIV